MGPTDDRGLLHASGCTLCDELTEDQISGSVPELWQLPLDFPVRPISRHGHGRPSHRRLHQILDRERQRYAGLLRDLLVYREALLEIPVEYSMSTEPCWKCGWLSGLDIVSLYGLVRLAEPRRIIEVGSGCSTKVVHRAVRDGSLDTELVSIDPEPREGIDAICTEVVRQRFEDADLSPFEELQAGDIVFIDGSHRVLTNSDATVMFLDVLPSLAPGVYVGCHDVWLPDDYPPDWWDRFYSEQYLLAAYLLAEGPRVEVTLPAWFVSHDRVLSGILAPLWEDARLASISNLGSVFWIRTR